MLTLLKTGLDRFFEGSGDMDWIGRSVWLSCVLATVVVAGWASESGAQDRIAYRDGDGLWRWVEPDGQQDFIRKAGPPKETIAGTFNVTYEDISLETGVGFDDPVAGDARRETLRSVFLYLSSVLDVPGIADFQVLASQTDGTGPLATAGPFLSPVTGFQGGFVYEHLTTGIDPRIDSLDGTVSVDFGYTWNSDTDLTSEIEYDLYTALLHEISHALGFFSVVGPDAKSLLLNVENAGLFGLLDALLVRGSTEEPLYLAGGEINATAEDVSSGDVLFAGPRAEAFFGEFPPVFASNPYIEATSIGHWSAATGSRAVMLAGLVLGDARRRYASWELQALGDIGYDVVACGDGFRAGAEQCDDGNTDDLDGCDSTCQSETATVPDAGIFDAGRPDAMVPEEPPRQVAQPDASQSRSPDDDLSSANASAAGCNVSASSPGGGWLVLLAFLLLRRRSQET
jgi:MYXO-CTERM domain-containing protein